MNARRQFLAAFGLVALAAPLRAQAPKEPRRIGLFFESGSPETQAPYIRAMTEGLAALGWKEGSNLVIEVAWGRGEQERYPAVVRELVARKPALIVVRTDSIAKIASLAAGEVPILFAAAFDPVGLGLVKSLANPGGRITGISSQNRELSPKRFALLKEAVPRLKRVGALYRKGDANAEHWLGEVVKLAGASGIRVIPAAIQRREDIAPAFEQFAKQKVSGVLHIPDTIFFEARVQMAELSIKHRMASTGGNSEFAVAGALLAYAPDSTAGYRRLAGIADKILRSANPGTIPVEQANVYELAVNLGTARAFGIKLPGSLMLQATRVIE